MRKWFGGILVAVLLAFTVWACSDTTAPVPGVVHVTPTLGNFQCGSNGGGSGGVIAVINTPQKDTVTAGGSTRYDTLTSVVWRDDPNAPGTQFYCTDTAVTVTYTQYRGTVLNGLGCNAQGNGSFVTFDHVWTQKLAYQFGSVGYGCIVGTASGHADTTSVRQQVI